jgi:hypothetical protein
LYRVYAEPAFDEGFNSYTMHHEREIALMGAVETVGDDVEMS